MIPLDVVGSKDIGASSRDKKKDMEVKKTDDLISDFPNSSVKKYKEWESNFCNLAKKYICMPLVCDGDIIKWPYDSSESEFFMDIYVGLLRYMAQRFAEKNKNDKNHNKYKDAVNYLYKNQRSR